MKKLILLLLMACPCVAQERLSMIYDAGNKSPTTSPLSIAHQFKGVPNANYFGVIASGSAMKQTAGWFHSNMADLGNGPQPTGGWLGLEYQGEVYIESCLPLKPAIGVHGFMPFGGDSARGCAQWMWSWDGVLAGRGCQNGNTYRQQNLYFTNSVNTGAEAVKRFIVDLRNTNFQNIPLTSQAGFNYCETAIGKYHKTFTVPNASAPCKNHLGVDEDGSPTFVIGAYDPNSEAKTVEILKFIHPMLDATAYLVDFNDAGPQIPAIQEIVGASKVYPVVTVTMNGSLNGQPAFTPPSFVSWLGTVSYPEAFIQCNSVVSGQNDCAAVAGALESLLSPNN